MYYKGMGGTDLKPSTFKPTVGMRSLHVCKSNVSRSGRMRSVSHITKRREAIVNWVQRKKSGIEVALRTHLLLQVIVERYYKGGQEKLPHAMTI